MRTSASLALLAALALAAPTLPAQAPAEPTAYSVTVEFHITGTAIRKTQRLGSLVLVDVTSPGATTTHILYNLDTHQSLTWNPTGPSIACKRETFADDAWQDPFSGLPDLSMKTAHHVGAEDLHGIHAQILESGETPNGHFRLWVDPATGLMLKAQMIETRLATTITYFEVTEVSLKPPPESTFAIPATCPAQNP